MPKDPRLSLLPPARPNDLAGAVDAFLCGEIPLADVLNLEHKDFAKLRRAVLERLNGGHTDKAWDALWILLVMGDTHPATIAMAAQIVFKRGNIQMASELLDRAIDEATAMGETEFVGCAENWRRRLERVAPP